ncbi:MAG: PadR family transcriptional regulator [Deltaproteobacteria bacterium]|nr:PadR family transcriptional regulator [Deltaproteobacteria bacterium]
MDIKSTLLGFLSRQSLTGYELKKRFAISFSFFSGLSYGSIYPALKKMEKEELVTQKLEIQDGAPNRKVYTITSAGRKAFIEALKEPFHWEMPKNTFLTRLFFFAHLSPEERQAAAREHLEALQETQRQIKAFRPKIEAGADFYQLQCYHFGLRFYQDIIRNVSEVIRALEKQPDE